MSMMNELEVIARKCGEIILSADNIDRDISAKEGPKNFVTKYDVLVQKTLEKELLALYPDAHFMGEEEETHQDISKGLAFIVDPIDGTTNFIKGYRTSVVSIAACMDGEIFCGVVYNPYTDTVYSAEKGKGAFVDGKPTKISGAELKDSVVCMGTSPYYPEVTDRTFSLARALFENALDLRRSGASALDLCQVACGRMDMMVECVMCPWDYAAAMCMIREAGGVITQLDGSPVSLTSRSSVIAGSPIAHKQFFEKGLDKI